MLFIFIILLLIIFFFFYWIGYFHVIFSKKIDRNSDRHAGEIVANVLKAHGVKFLFTLTGGHISPILVASERKGIRVVDVRHEATAVFAADAVGRLSGGIGVAAVTAGPGVTNTITALKNAQMAESPVLLIGGAAATFLKGRGALQDIDQMALLRPICKFTATARRIQNIRPLLYKAIQVAQSDTPGPVFVEFPIDLLYPYRNVAQEIGLSSGAGAGGIMKKLINFYLQTRLDCLFANGFDDLGTQLPLPWPVSFPLASSKQMQRCMKLISRCKKPVLLLGSQSVTIPTAVDDLRRAVETFGVPTFLGGMSRGLLGSKSSIQFRHCRKDALKEADCIILAGTVCDFRLSYGRSFNKKAKIISINRDASQLKKNSDLFWSAAITVQADVASSIVRIVEGLPGYKCEHGWIESLRQKDIFKENEIRERGRQATEQHLNPIKILMELEDFLPEKSILVADGGDFVGTAAYILRPRAPLTWLDPGAFGTLGVGGGFALGAKLCRPDHDVWIIYGDGSLGFSVAEFDTFTRHKTPVIALVGNDACWSQIARDQQRILQAPTACNLAFCKYELVCNGFGGKGFQINRDSQNISIIFDEAIRNSRRGTSVLLNCFIGKTDFRDGSISV
ncbi:hypothetical protein HELRODRAFT_185752 [Helobdella robusta]|uniref:2-hydroxyacyl-CoA lyase 2 n=1 Tax=Helobdella robusta TaxID=6412 RepID=T1FN89_HELRO|nr:hypothetical protein HELRODRAFT_185752 [Helobdella robusta]ESO00593.1 hypothetical protein HELRODRAFT_185752 [Helobdella robusta]